MTKQVIIIRNDLNMRKGKMVAQGCHACLGAVRLAWPKDLAEWEKTGTRKIALYVKSEEELVRIYEIAQVALIPSYLVTDSGLTEFNGVPTKTAVAIGPADADAIDKITGTLPLL